MTTSDHRVLVADIFNSRVSSGAWKLSAAGKGIVHGSKEAATPNLFVCLSLKTRATWERMRVGGTSSGIIKLNPLRSDRVHGLPLSSAASLGPGVLRQVRVRTDRGRAAKADRGLLRSNYAGRPDQLSDRAFLRNLAAGLPAGVPVSSAQLDYPDGARPRPAISIPTGMPVDAQFP